MLGKKSAPYPPESPIPVTWDLQQPQQVSLEVPVSSLAEMAEGELLGKYQEARRELDVSSDLVVQAEDAATRALNIRDRWIEVLDGYKKDLRKVIA